MKAIAGRPPITNEKPVDAMKRRTPVQFPAFSFIFRAKLRVLASEENQIVSPLENHERVACSSIRLRMSF
jgi:hypothetical protein